MRGARRRAYNPNSVLNLLKHGKFRGYWFETGTPGFLVDLIVERGLTALDLEELFASEELLSSFDIERIIPEALLFQTGYLTILGEADDPHPDPDAPPAYRLGYPNDEVRHSFRQIWQHGLGSRGGI